MPRFGWLAPLMDLKPYRNVHHLRRVLDLRHGLSVLDVGGGTGIVEARARIDGAVVADPQPRMVERCRDKGRGLVPVLADGAALPFTDDSFDRVMIVDALHHIPDPETALVEAARVMKPEGRLVVEEILPSSAFGVFVRGLEWMGRFGSRFFEPEELKVLIERVGLDCKVEKWSPRTYAAIGVEEHVPAERPGALA